MFWITLSSISYVRIVVRVIVVLKRTVAGHPDDGTKRTTDIPEFKPFTIVLANYIDGE